MFLNKKKPKFRRRVEDNDDAGSEEKPSAPVASTQTSSSNVGKTEKAKEKPKSFSGTGRPSLLSFGDDGEDGEDTTAITRKKENHKLPVGGAKMLSFGAGGEDESEDMRGTAKGKKGFGASHGQGHKLGTGKISRDSSVKASPSTLQPTAGEYTKEKLAELAKNTRTLGPKKPPPPPPKPSESNAEPVIVLKGLLKPPSSVSSNTALGSVPGEYLGVRSSVSAQPDLQSEMENRLGLMGIGSGAEGGGVTHIPDAAAIAAAKAKRERLRQAETAPDYIPIAGSGELGRPDRGRYRESGLVREKDDDLEAKEGEGVSSGEDDEATRMVFLGEIGKAKKRGERGGRRVAKDASAEGGGVRDKRGSGVEEGGGILEVDEGGAGAPSGEGARVLDEEDEEALRWEEEQLRKGVGKRVEEVPLVSGKGPLGIRPAGGTAVGRVGELRGPGEGVWAIGARIQGETATQQGQAVMKSLRDGLLRLREAHLKSRKDVARAERSLVQAAENVIVLEGAQAEVGAKYRFVQELRDYVATLCDFLRDKAPLIEELEEEMEKVHEDRAQALFERRAADHADEMAEAEAAMAAALAAMGRGAGTATAERAAMAAAEAVREGTGMAPQLDEFGRDVNMQKRMDAKRRAEARERRKARVGARRAGRASEDYRGPANGAPSLMEGESSSDESESEQTAYTSARQEVLAVSDGVFGDAAEEFSTLAIVKSRFETWKTKYPASYRDAYCSLSAPTLFAPYVRLELLRWDPLYGNVGFESMNWYNTLFDYGMPDNSVEEAPAGDPDSNLVPRLVEKVALPILRKRLARCWDPTSLAASARAAAALQEMLVYVPLESEAMQELLTDVKSRLADAVAKSQVPAWTLAVISAVPSARRLASQRFGAALRLVRCIATWHEVVARPVLDRLAIEELVDSQLLPHLRTLVPTVHDAVSRTEQLLAALKTLWIGPSATSQTSIQMAPLVSYVGTLARTLESRKVGGTPLDEVLGLARRIKQMLVGLNEYDKARSVAKKFQLKEAM